MSNALERLLVRVELLVHLEMGAAASLANGGDTLASAEAGGYPENVKTQFERGLALKGREYAGPGEPGQAQQLVHAVQKGRMPQIKTLVENLGAGVNDPAPDDTSSITTALVEAARSLSSSSTDIMYYLLGKGANPSACTGGGNKRTTALLEAACTGSVLSLTLLLACGGDANCVNGLGQSPLIMAVERGSLECCQVLIDAGADLTVTNRERDGMTALAMAEAYSEEEDKKEDMTLLVKMIKGEARYAFAADSIIPPPSSSSSSSLPSAADVNGGGHPVPPAAAGQGKAHHDDHSTINDGSHEHHDDAYIENSMGCSKASHAQHMGTLAVSAEPHLWLDTLPWAADCPGAARIGSVDMIMDLNDKEKYPDLIGLLSEPHRQQMGYLPKDNFKCIANMSFSEDETLLYLVRSPSSDGYFPEHYEYTEGANNHRPLIALDVESGKIKFTVPPEPKELSPIKPPAEWEFVGKSTKCNVCKQIDPSLKHGHWMCFGSNESRPDLGWCDHSYVCTPCKEAHGINERHKGQPACGGARWTRRWPPAEIPDNAPAVCGGSLDNNSRNGSLIWHELGGPQGNMMLLKVTLHNSRCSGWATGRWMTYLNAQAKGSKDGRAALDFRDKNDKVLHANWAVFSRQHDDNGIRHNQHVLWPETLKLWRIMVDDCEGKSNDLMVAPHVEGKPDIIAFLPRTDYFSDINKPKSRPVLIYDWTHGKVISEYWNQRGIGVDVQPPEGKQLSESDVGRPDPLSAGKFSPNRKWFVTDNLLRLWNDRKKAMKEDENFVVHLWPVKGKKLAATLVLPRNSEIGVFEWLDDNHILLFVADKMLTYAIVKDGKSSYKFKLMHKYKDDRKCIGGESDINPHLYYHMTKPCAAFDPPVEGEREGEGGGGSSSRLILFNNNDADDDNISDRKSHLELWRVGNCFQEGEGDGDGKGVKGPTLQQVFAFTDSSKAMRDARQERSRARGGSSEESKACISASGKYVALSMNRLLVWKMHYGADAETAQYSEKFPGETADTSVEYFKEEQHDEMRLPRDGNYMYPLI